jgi:ligand-binding SRPBCC domain-containing protein
MIRGAFAVMRHQHHFEEVNGYTIMSDTFEYQVPFGWIGKIFDKLILRNYMIQFLTARNKVIKQLAEKK